MQIDSYIKNQTNIFICNNKRKIENQDDKIIFKSIKNIAAGIYGDIVFYNKNDAEIARITGGIIQHEPIDLTFNEDIIIKPFGQFSFNELIVGKNRSVEILATSASLNIDENFNPKLMINGIFTLTLLALNVLKKFEINGIGEFIANCNINVESEIIIKPLTTIQSILISVQEDLLIKSSNLYLDVNILTINNNMQLISTESKMNLYKLKNTLTTNGGFILIDNNTYKLESISHLIITS